MNSEGQAGNGITLEPSDEGLRQVLLRLTRPGVEPLQDQIQDQLQALEALRASLEELRSRSNQGDEELSSQIERLSRRLQEARQSQAQLAATLDELEKNLQAAFDQQSQELARQAVDLQQQVNDPQQVSQRVSPVLISLLSQRARSNREEFAEAVAPAVGPAIRHQIREAREDIIESLYPVIGQIIAKAVGETFRELTRNIDARLRQQLRLRSRISSLLARLRGVSEAELLLRESLPFSIQHVFLIHRQNGLLLDHISASGEQTQDLDLISGMLTAIRDFVRDSFGKEESDLEEIAQGDLRFLLETGQYAYVAVVLKGIEPPGYNGLIHQVIHAINLHYEKELSAFDGEMGNLPNFKPSLAPLLAPDPEQLESELALKSLSRNQKWAAAGILGGGLIALALAAFACIFSIRLWPYAFAPAQPTPAPLQAVLPTVTLTPTALPSPTPTPLPSPSLTPTPSSTPSPNPTVSPTLPATATPITQAGISQGTLNLREGPGLSYRIVGFIEPGQQVTILKQQGDWLFVQVQAAGQEMQSGWVWARFVTIQPGG